MMLAVLQNLCDLRDQWPRTPTWAARRPQTFFRTDEETLGNGIGWSLSPTSIGERGGQIWNASGEGRICLRAYF